MPERGGGGGVGGGGNAWDWWWKESMRWSGDARPDASPCAAASMVSIRSEATDRCDGGSGVDAAKVASEAAASDSMTLLFDFGGGRPCNVGGAVYIYSQGDSCTGTARRKNGKHAENIWGKTAAHQFTAARLKFEVHVRAA